MASNGLLSSTGHPLLVPFPLLINLPLPIEVRPFVHPIIVLWESVPCEEYVSELVCYQIRGMLDNCEDLI